MWQRRRERQRVRDIARVAAGLGHDINNMLMVVLAATDVVADPGAKREDLSRAAVDLEDAAQRAAVLARQLLVLGKPGRPRLALVRPGEELRRLEPTLLRAVGPKVRLAMEITSELPTIIDGSQLGQAMMNLAVNARDAMPDGGDIRIAASDVIVDELRDAAPLPGRYVAIAVEDNGMGMDEDTRSRALTPYFTTKPDGEGTGLGLSVVDGIVRQHGGYVDIESRRGRGTKVTLYLPAFAA